MKIKAYWEQWKSETAKARKERFLLLSEQFDKMLAEYQLKNREGKSPCKTNLFGELLALESLCKNDALSLRNVYHEDKWVDQLVSGKFGETPSDAYENLEKFLNQIDGIEIVNRQEQANSNISFVVHTRFYDYDYITKYHFVDGGCIVMAHCSGRTKSAPTQEEWKAYINS